MQKKCLLLIAIVLLVMAYTAHATVWDCGTDFNSISNPSGVWGFYTGNGTLMISGPGNLNGPPIGWQSPTENWVGLYGWSSGPGGNLEDPNDFAGHNPWIVRWTSPIEGWVRISGRSFQRAWDSGLRLITWRLRHNGIEFNHGHGEQDPTTKKALLGSTGAASFADGTGGDVGLLQYVYVGDTIELLTTGTVAAEWPLGAPGGSEPFGTATICQFTIHTTEAPQTATLTMVANPAIAGPSVSPPPGTDDKIALGTQKPISAAASYIDCPTVMAFSHWTGDGVANPTALSTTVDMSTDRVITAVYVDNRVCGDVCHPNWPAVPADLNDDCIVDINDLEMLAAGWLDSTHPDDD